MGKNEERKRETKRQHRKKKKKKLTCCQRFCRKIRRCLCRRLKRCIKKKVFGSPDPHLDDYDVAGYNLGSVRDKIVNKSKNKLDLNEKYSVMTVFRKENMKPYKEAITDELDRYSLLSEIKNKALNINEFMDFKHGSKIDMYKSKLQESKEKLSKTFLKYLEKNKDSKLLRYISATVLKRKFSLTESKQNILDKMIKDYKDGKIRLSDFNKGSKVDFANLDKDRFHKILREYEKNQKRQSKEFLKKFNVNDLKFSLTKSKQNILNEMIKDHKEGKIRISDFNKGSQIDFANMDKERLHKIMRDYENQKKLQNKEFLKNMNINDIKKKFAVSESQQEIFKMLVDDYKKGKLNDPFLKKISKLDMKNITQERFQKVLQDYQTSRKKVNYKRESKLQQARSFVKSKIGSRGKVKV